MARTDLAAPRFADYFTIGQAAEFLGVSAATLRNWDRSGKLKPRRHPQNGYRIYRYDDLLAVLRQAAPSPSSYAFNAFAIDWSAMRGGEHLIQFYESDDYLVEAACDFLSAGLADGDIGVVVATPDHQQAIASYLKERKIDTEAASDRGDLLMYDAHDTLSQFMVGDKIDKESFHATISREVLQLAASGRHVRAFGEMVALLWQQGSRQSAVQLEHLWHTLAQQHQFAVLCAYPLDAFAGDIDGREFDELCACHTHVQPTEAYGRITSDEARLHAVSKLQQQVFALRTELRSRDQRDSSVRSPSGQAMISN